MKNNLIKRILLGGLSFSLFASPVSENRILMNTKYKYEKEIKKNFHLLEEINYLNDREDIHNNSKDYWQTPEETFFLKTGDCEDKSIYFQDILKSKGINTSLAFGRIKRNSLGKHAWLEYSIGKSDYIIECSLKGQIACKDTFPTKKHYLYLKSDNPYILNYIINKNKFFKIKKGKELRIKNLEK